MFHELRIYRCQPGKLKNELDRMKEAARELFPRHGIKAVGYWTVMVGPSDHDIYYMLEWVSLEERSTKWKAFGVDPKWIKLFKESEQDGTLLTSITNIFLKPLAFGEAKKI